MLLNRQLVVFVLTSQINSQEFFMDDEQIKLFAELLVRCNYVEPVLKRLFVTVLWDDKNYPANYSPKHNKKLGVYIDEHLTARPKTPEELAKIILEVEKFKIHLIDKETYDKDRNKNEEIKTKLKREARVNLIHLILDNCGLLQLGKLMKAFLAKEDADSYMRGGELHVLLVQEIAKQNFSVFNQVAMIELEPSIETNNILLISNENQLNACGSISKFYQHLLFRETTEEQNELSDFKYTLYQNHRELIVDLLKNPQIFTISLKFILQLLKEDLKTKTDNIIEKIFNTLFVLRVLNAWIIDYIKDYFLRINEQGSLQEAATIFILTNDLSQLFSKNLDSDTEDKKPFMLFDNNQAKFIKEEIDKLVKLLLDSNLTQECQIKMPDICKAMNVTTLELDLPYLTASNKLLTKNIISTFLTIEAEENEVLLCLYTLFLSYTKNNSATLQKFSSSELLNLITKTEDRHIAFVRKNLCPNEEVSDYFRLFNVYADTSKDKLAKLRSADKSSIEKIFKEKEMLDEFAFIIIKLSFLKKALIEFKSYLAGKKASPRYSPSKFSFPINVKLSLAENSGLEPNITLQDIPEPYSFSFQQLDKLQVNSNKPKPVFPEKNIHGDSLGKEKLLLQTTISSSTASSSGYAADYEKSDSAYTTSGKHTVEKLNGANKNNAHINSFSSSDSDSNSSDESDSDDSNIFKEISDEDEISDSEKITSNSIDSTENEVTADNSLKVNSSEIVLIEALSKLLESESENEEEYKLEFDEVSLSPRM